MGEEAAGGLLATSLHSARVIWELNKYRVDFPASTYDLTICESSVVRN